MMHNPYNRTAIQKQTDFVLKKEKKDKEGADKVFVLSLFFRQMTDAEVFDNSSGYAGQPSE